MLTLPQDRASSIAIKRLRYAPTPRSSGCSSSSPGAPSISPTRRRPKRSAPSAALAEAESAAQAAQVRALRYQVNPHFLFNTLNSLSSLVMAGRADRAETMLLALSTFFRTSLSLDPERRRQPGRGDRPAAALSRHREGALSATG